jgi:hypothetical protein
VVHDVFSVSIRIIAMLVLVLLHAQETMVSLMIVMVLVDHFIVESNLLGTEMKVLPGTVLLLLLVTTHGLGSNSDQN